MSMKQFYSELNHEAVDVALRALYGDEGHTETRRVYNLIDGVMQKAHDAAKFEAGEVEALKTYHEASVINERAEAFERGRLAGRDEVVAALRSVAADQEVLPKTPDVALSFPPEAKEPEATHEMLWAAQRDSGDEA